MVQSNQLLLHIRAGSHLLRRTDKHSDLTVSHLAEQFLFLRFGICRMDIGNFLFRNTFRYQLVAQIIIDIESTVTVGSREVAEYHLRRTLVGGFLPDIKDIVGTGGYLARLTVG